MKKVLFFLLFSLVPLSISMAQQFTHEFGKTSNEEYVITQYDKDPNAEAFYIYDIGDCHYYRDDNGFNLVFEERFKIKVLTKAGIKYSEFEIPFYSSDNGHEEILDLEGYTYNFENGKLTKTPLNKKQFYDEKISEHWTNRKFVMPEVKEGSVIEVRYKLQSPYLFNYRNWEFQHRIPTLYSEYTAKMIPFYEYIYIAQGITKFDSFKSYEENGFKERLNGFEYSNMVYNFVMENQPAYKDAEFVTSPNDYIAKIDFQLAIIHHLNGVNEKIMTTWPNLIEKFYDNDYFGKFLKAASKSAKSVTDTMNIALLSPSERARSIVNYVKNSFNWDGTKTKFTEKTFKEFFKSKKGNAAEINLYLLALLNSVGLKAYPALLSTRDHGKIKSDYPFESFFNYVIVEFELGDNIVTLDATEPFCAFGELPTRCINEKALIMNKQKVEWLFFNQSKISLTSDSLQLTINPTTDSISVSGSIMTSDYSALEARKSVSSSGNDLRKTLSLQHLNLIDSLKYTNQDKPDEPFFVNFKALSPIEQVDNKLIVEPFMGIAISENPFKQIVRQYPIDLIYPASKKYTSIINIPDGYTVLNLPKNLKLNNSIIEIVYQSEYLNDRTLKITAIYALKRAIYENDLYLSLKGLLSVVVEKFNEKLILEKKKN